MAPKPIITSDALSALRGFLEQSPELEEYLGKIAHFNIILDANMAVGDLLHKALNTRVQQTRIEEVIKSSVITLYAPTWLDHEMVTSAIPQAAKKRKVSEDTLQTLWSEYKKLIVWNDDYFIPENLETTGDDKDLPYVALQKSLNAEAILSRDSDIDELGGTRVDMEFIIYAQTYARSTAVSVGLKVGGLFLGRLGFEIFIQLLKSAGGLLTRLPNWAKFVLFISIVLAITHPRSRAWIAERLGFFSEAFKNVLPEIMSIIDHVSEMQLEANLALLNAGEMVCKNQGVRMTEDFTNLLPDEIAQVAVKYIEADGLFWISMTRTPSEHIMSEVRKLIDDSNLYLHSPPPDWDHVIIDIKRYPTWTRWVNDHAMDRYKLKENGVPDHQLPALPKGVYPEDYE